jgi:hypothetical protein
MENVPGFSLWQYSERLLDGWNVAEKDLTRAARWLVVLGAVQLLILLNLHKFGPGSETTEVTVATIRVTVPGYWLAVLLPFAAAYFVMQYMHSWVVTKVLGTVHGAVVRRLVDPAGEDDTSDGPSALRGTAGEEARDVAMTLMPTASVGGRLPTGFGIAWRDQVGTRSTGLTAITVTAAFEALAFWRLQPFAVDAPQVRFMSVWVVSLLATALMLAYAYGFSQEPGRWRTAEVVTMLRRLEGDGRIAR